MGKAGWSPPKEFDGYRMERLLGRGGMGMVFTATDTVLERPVAIKFIATSDATIEDRKRFLVEARAIARLQHPNVVAIFRVGEVEGHPYLVSELVRGRGLDRLATPVTGDRLVRIGLGIATGLAAAHARGVVHRDIKPANVLLTDDGEIKILDFGIAKLLDPGGEMAKRESLDPPPYVRSKVPPRPVAFSDPDAVTADIPVDSSAVSSLSGLPVDGHITRPGIVVGTPYYLAPELWRGEAATFASDIYAIGVLLFALATGYTPHEALQETRSPDAPTPIAFLRDAVQSRDATKLREAAPDVDPAFAAVVDRCLMRSPGDRFASAHELRTALLELGAPHDRPAVQGNPYRGLHAFDAEHSAVFFGREGEVATITERLRTETFVLVAGDSGVGKSSLCRAGVLPRAAKALDSGRTWSVCTAVPGRFPVATFAAALAAVLGVPEEIIAESLAEDAGAFGREMRKILGSSKGLVLFVDQLEELVTLSEEKQSAMIGALLEQFISPNPSLRLLATVRGDFLSRLAHLTPLEGTLSRALYFLRPLSADRVREAIVAPARAKGGRFESEKLVSMLVESAAGADGSLPLLQFALAELWEARDRKGDIITEAALEQVGGVAGALSRHADALVSSLAPEERKAARDVLLGLVTTSATRASKTAEEVVLGRREARAALEALVQGRIVVVRETPEGATYEIAHEALITGWATMVAWRTEDAGERLVRERLAAAVADWERKGRAPDTLFGATSLDEARRLSPLDLTPAERAFVAASRRAQLRTKALRIGAAVGFPLALALTYGAFVAKARADLRARATVELRAAEKLIVEAEAAAKGALSKEADAFARFDEQAIEDGEARFREAEAKRADMFLLYSKASQHLETALTWDREREDVRHAFAALLYERARLSEQRHGAADRDELLSRLALYDDDGALRRRWNARATVSLRLSRASSPNLAALDAVSVQLSQFVADERGVRRSVPLETLLARDFTHILLPPGSYLAAVDDGANAPIRVPFLAERGAVLDLDVSLPAAPLPKGFVYVPRGLSLFGSHDDDSVRRGFFRTVPEHPFLSDAFLVAEKETTFGDWIEYLRALPKDERAKRLPSVKGGFQGALELSEQADGAFELSFQPSGRRFKARMGESVVYEDRETRKAQRWALLPVVGITAEDAEAYARWLAVSGRVPWARLCNEHEWERAARGADDRVYPHGDALLPDDANFDETYKRSPKAMGPDEVGSHSASRSPFGVDDMSGNVWEWTVSSVEPHEHAARGGSFYFDDNSSRVYSRQVTESSFRDVSVGVRICANPPRAALAR